MCQPSTGREVKLSWYGIFFGMKYQARAHALRVASSRPATTLERRATGRRRAAEWRIIISRNKKHGALIGSRALPAWLIKAAVSRGEISTIITASKFR